jgi:hypothetical protein
LTITFLPLMARARLKRQTETIMAATVLFLLSWVMMRQPWLWTLAVIAVNCESGETAAEVVEDSAAPGGAEFARSKPSSSIVDRPFYFI